MTKAARIVLYALVPAELIIFVLLASGVFLPRPVLIAGEAAVSAVLLFEIAVAAGIVRGERRRGADWRTALRAPGRLVPEPVRRIMGFDMKGLVSLVLLAARRRHGVPPGAVAVPYSGGQLTLQMAFLFAMALEVVCLEIVLRALDVPEGLRMTVLVVDLYSVLIVLAVIAAGVTRPHVLTDEELRIRYGAFFDLRVPRERIASMRITRSFNEEGMIKVVDDQLAVAVASQTNVVVELDEPVIAVRPLGARAAVRTIRFYADDPAAVVGASGGRGLAGTGRPAPERAG